MAVIPNVKSLYLGFCFLITLSGVVAENGFFSPTFHSATPSGKYAGDSVWAMGSSQLISFDTTWSEYRIELWQQSLTGSTATKSSTLIYNQTIGQDLPQSFNWTVQTYDRVLADSPIFFLWLKGNDSAHQQTSAFFNVTSPSASTTSITTSTISTTTTSSQSMSSLVSTSTSTSLSTTSSMSIVPAATTTNANASGNSQSTVTGHVTVSDKLSSGAITGIAVAVSIFGTAALVCVGFLCWNRRKKQIEEDGQQKHYHENPQELPVYVGANQWSDIGMLQRENRPYGSENKSHPAELYSYNLTYVAEMGGK